MISLYFLGLLIVSSFIDCKIVKTGVFDNVTVFIQGSKRTSKPEAILIDFDDNLADYIKTKPSKIITIKNQFIPKLEPNSISNLPKVEALTLASNGIREIRRGAFKNLPNLKLLNLSHNLLEEIRQGIFNDLPMRDLYLDNNKISRIGYKAFSNLHLRNLFLNNNKISRWSKDWFAETSVLVLDLSHNLIEDLPANSFNLMAQPVKGNMSLIFTGNQLKKINNHVFNGFENFHKIFFDSNLIDRLDGEVFNQVKYVRVLNLNNNSLTEIRGDLLKNTQVDVFMVEDNKLKCVSTELFRMEELDVDGNPISCFCVKTWLDWRNVYSNPSIYHISNLEEDCI